MKSKTRKIIVQDTLYVWSVSKHNCDGDGGDLLKIWKDKMLVYSNILHGVSIKPSFVKEVIQLI